MKINICIIDADNRLGEKQWKIIKPVVEKHSKIAGKALSLTSMNICVYPNKDWCISQTGDGGYTASFDWIQLFIDPTKLSHIPKILESSFPANIYHEMHHAKRMMEVGFGQSLLEVAVSEGLAIVFAEEMFSVFKAPWGRYSKSEIVNLLKVFDSNRMDRKFNYEEWFLGHGKPHWLGYKVGTYIVRELKRQDGKFSCDKMVATKAVDIYKKWHENL